MIGDRIRDLRNNHRMSQTELSKILHVSQQTVTKWETGKAEPSSNAVANLADYFNVSADYILGRTSSKSNSEDLPSDLDKMLDSAESFDGKPMTKHDREIIKAYLEGHFGTK